jgi:hypothetical protein
MWLALDLGLGLEYRIKFRASVQGLGLIIIVYPLIRCQRLASERLTWPVCCCRCCCILANCILIIVCQ